MHAGSPPALRLDVSTLASLAALGPLLCLYRAVETHVLTGLSHAAAIIPSVRIDNDGPSEALMFLEANGRPCWQLYVLPDSDYFAWETLLTRLSTPTRSAAVSSPDPATRSCIHRGVGNPIWRASALRLHALPSCQSPSNVAASVAPLSACGQRAAERLASNAHAVFQSRN